MTAGQEVMRLLRLFPMLLLEKSFLVVDGRRYKDRTLCPPMPDCNDNSNKILTSAVVNAQPVQVKIAKVGQEVVFLHS